MNGNSDLFKQEFKYYKGRAVRPDLSKVIDFEKRGIKSSIFLEPTEADCERLGFISGSKICCYEFPANPGLLVVPNPFTVDGQRVWISKCLRCYPMPPNPTNTSTAFPEVSHGSLQSEPFYRNLRWTTLGLHHDWNSKLYDPEHRSPFPECLKELATRMAHLMGFCDYRPEAAIVNYYAMDSTLGGHVDHSESDHTQPLFSVSFGQTAVFLIGGSSRNVRPTAMFLKSGDVVVMTGESRLAYHAVPLVLPRGDDKPWGGTATGDEAWNLLADYVSNHRININVRQVFPLDKSENLCT